MTAEKTIKLESFLPYRIANLSNNISEAFSAVYSLEYGISIAQWRILVNLFENDFVTAKNLGNLASMDKSTVSRAIQIMLNRGYLEKRVNKDDKRAYFVALTEEGKELYYEIAPKALTWESHLKSGISDEEYECFMSVLAKLDNKVKS
ncbi:MarR family winged helix-turn-helix transcriptional regulator [Pseudoalteromonas sp. C2R02]|uniref:MarR family winged helix-turn-helix transcriptional regulator n=1 Tax=Pseudoalteromonas sp. C2R02 TaxID=2841565 RepID=UPI001C094284|nr:MarR family winged helix-turn-helix transcriptional regulator [Pseudoalteromonas sp. C2R02]MBU2970534.1 MarR family winged helix-turn-helix transcriptional regulator [Pseudoalteromonas sp. C2R02]